MRRRGLGLLMALAACSGSAGADGSDLLVPFESLHGGIVFANNRIPGSAGYDLYWVPFPDVRIAGAYAPTRLTSTQADEWQPAVAANGKAIAYVANHEIYFVGANGRVRQITDHDGTKLKDSLPALSRAADRIAWVREDLDKPIGQTGFFETVVMMAHADGTNITTLSPTPSVIQDSPVFDPSRDSTRIAWTEWNAATLHPQVGPVDYGIRIYDFANKTSSFACQSQNGQTPGTQNLEPRDLPYRCFGQHLAWPRSDVMVLGQDLLEVYLGGPLASVWAKVVRSLQAQQSGIPDIGARQSPPLGFFPRFPLSVSYSATSDAMVFDGVVSSLQGDLPSLAFFVANADGDGPRRVEIVDFTADIDTRNTADYLFSVATPRIVPFPTD